MYVVRKPPPRNPPRRNVAGEDKEKKEEVLPGLNQDRKGKAAPGSFPQHSHPASVIYWGKSFSDDCQKI